MVVFDRCCGFILLECGGRLGHCCRYLDVLAACIWGLQVFAWGIGVEFAAWPTVDVMGAVGGKTSFKLDDGAIG